MDPDTFRGDVGVADPDVYWRRRVSVLTGVLVVVAVIVWACSAASKRLGDDPKGTGGAAASNAPAPARHLASSATPAATGHAEQAIGDAQADDPAGDPAHASAGVRRTGRSGDPCDPADLVVHLQTLRDVYPAGAHPTFLLMLVNTGPVACTADVGPRTLEVRITSGPDRVWSTADCVSGDTARHRRLERGIPFVRTIDWNRHRSGTDCAAPHPPARPGTYIGVAPTPHLTSRKAVFHLK
jgi:hypothetical protein